MRLTRSGVATGFIVVLALWLGSLVTSALPDPDDVYDQPFVTKASVNQEVEIRTAKLNVTGVRSGPEFQYATFVDGQAVNGTSTIAATTAIWLVIDITYEPTGQTSSLQGLRVKAADGRLFGADSVTIPCGPTQPGMALNCAIPFEVPKDALAGAHLLVPAAGLVDAADSLADIDLGIDAAEATTLGAATERQMIDPKPAGEG